MDLAATELDPHSVACPWPPQNPHTELPTHSRSLGATQTVQLRTDYLCLQTVEIIFQGFLPLAFVFKGVSFSAGSAV